MYTIIPLCTKFKNAYTMYAHKKDYFGFKSAHPLYVHFSSAFAGRPAVGRPAARVSAIHFSCRQQAVSFQAAETFGIYLICFGEAIQFWGYTLYFWRLPDFVGVVSFTLHLYKLVYPFLRWNYFLGFTWHFYRLQKIYTKSSFYFFLFISLFFCISHIFSYIFLYLFLISVWFLCFVLLASVLAFTITILCLLNYRRCVLKSKIRKKGFFFGFRI